MFVSDWMTKKVFTVTPDDNITAAIKLLKCPLEYPGVPYRRPKLTSL